MTAIQNGYSLYTIQCSKHTHNLFENLYFHKKILLLSEEYVCCSRLPEGLEDVSTYPALFAELLKRGYSSEDLMKIAGKNLVRVFREAEKVNTYESCKPVLSAERHQWQIPIHNCQ